MMNRGILILFLLLCPMAGAQDVTAGVSLYAGGAVSYTPWKSFGGFAKEYNTVNAASLKSGLGVPSLQYGTDLAFECFVTRHFYSSVEWGHFYGKTSAEFTNGARRLFSINMNAIDCFIGWKQFTPKGAWGIATGIGGLFANLDGWIRFPDGTHYYGTEGFSGQFADVNFGVPLKFDYERRITGKLAWRLGVRGHFYTSEMEDGMSNVFATKTTGSVGLGDKVVKLDVSGAAIHVGIVYHFYTAWED